MTTAATAVTPAATAADVEAFIEPRQPSFAWGQRVVALCDLHNDGSHPEREPDALLVPAGSVGEVVNVGHATEANEPVYLVEFVGSFGTVVVGSVEDELAPVPMGWQPEEEGDHHDSA